jgi:peptidoglycan hydrolase CwlO-like protein
LNINKTKIHLFSSKKIIFLGLSVFVLSGFISFQHIKADTANDTAQKIKDLEEKANVYNKIIDIKQKQEDTLDNQISILENEISQMETETDLKKQEIDVLNGKITDLEKKIEETEVSIELQKKILADLLQVYYENKDQDVVTAFLSDKNLSSFMSRDDRLVQVEDKTSEILKNIKSLKDGMENEKNSIEQKKKEVTGLFYDLQEKTSELNDKKDQKELLMNQTQGEQSKYEKLLANVEEQKQELLNIDELGGTLSADSYSKPPSSAFASVSWYYSQRDSRWGDQSIGNSKTSMKSYGCAVTALSMVFTYYGDSVTPGTCAKKKIFYFDLIAWPQSSFGGKVSLVGGTSHGNINWSTIDAELKKKNPVIVYIRKKKGSGGHYVVIHTKMANGKYVVHDPYWGANLYLDTSRALVGALNPQGDTTIDQMIIYEKK